MSEQSTKPAYTKPLPDMRPEGDHFWAGTREHKLLLPTDSSGTPFWYPRALTPGTLEPVQWIESAGTGSVYTYSVHYIADPALRRAIANFLVREREHVDAACAELAEYAPYRKASPDQA